MKRTILGSNGSRTALLLSAALVFDASVVAAQTRRDGGMRDAATRDAGASSDAGVMRDARASTDGAATASAASDAEIAAIGAAIHAGEIEQGRLAQSKTTHAAVRSFAEAMVTEHTAATQQQTTLLQRLRVTPAPNATSRRLAADSQRVVQELTAMPAGARFDQAYVAGQVRGHRDALQMLDTVLIPGARNAELRAMLQQLRPRVEAHLGHAQQLQSQLASGAPGRSGAAPGHTGNTPGQSGTAPGRSGSTPGQSGTAPGQMGHGPGHSGMH